MDILIANKEGLTAPLSEWMNSDGPHVPRRSFIAVKGDDYFHLRLYKSFGFHRCL